MVKNVRLVLGHICIAQEHIAPPEQRSVKPQTFSPAERLVVSRQAEHSKSSARKAMVAPSQSTMLPRVGRQMASPQRTACYCLVSTIPTAQSHLSYHFPLSIWRSCSCLHTICSTHIATAAFLLGPGSLGIPTPRYALRLVLISQHLPEGVSPEPVEA